MVLMNPLASLAKTGLAGKASGMNELPSAGDGFANLLRDAIKDTVGSQRIAEKMTFASASGQENKLSDNIYTYN